MIRLLAFLLVALCFVTSTTAQDAPNYAGSDHLAAMLRFVPDNDGARDWLTFVDYTAAEAARGVAAPDAYAALDADSTALWWASVPHSGLALDHFADFGQMPVALGIDFFDIDQSVVWGLPPDVGIILRGNFDESAIRTAHEVRGFIESPIDGTPRWCALAGCEAGFQVNLEAVQPADVFGGDLGRRFPRALQDGYLFGAGLDSAVEAMQAAGVNGAGRLGDDPAYAAAVRVLDGEHHLRAVQFARPDDFLALSLDGLPAGATEDQTMAYLTALRGGEDDLPAFTLAVIADAADANAEYAFVGLVYEAEAGTNVVAAANILAERLGKSRSAVLEDTWMGQIIAQSGVISSLQVIRVSAVDRHVVLLTLIRPLPSTAPDESGQYEPSGALFNLLLDGYARRDLGWLQPDYDLPPIIDGT